MLRTSYHSWLCVIVILNCRMSDLSSYRDKCTLYGKLANDYEQKEDYESAYYNYTRALDIFSHMIKCKSDP